MTEPGDEVAADAEGGDRLRACHASRERVIGTLKAAFAQGRLTEDEYDARVGQASASRTHAELAALIADLPAGSAAARLPKASDVRTGACVILVAASVLGPSCGGSPDNILAFMTALLAAATVVVASPITVGLTVDAWRRSGLTGSYRRGHPASERHRSAERAHVLSLDASGSIAVASSPSRKPPDWCCHSLA